MNTSTLERTTQATQTTQAISNTEINQAIKGSEASTIKATPHTNGLGVAEELEKLGEVLGQFKAYDSQLPITEIKGTRIVKCLYQLNPKTKTKAQENAYVRLPTKHLTEEHIVSRITELSPYVLAMLQEVEDKKIKEEHKNGACQVFTDYLTLDGIIELLEASSESSRLNKDKIEAWFSDKLEDTLAELFGAKMGISENSSEHDILKLAQVINAYKAKFATLVSPKAYLKEEDCLAMIRVIESVEEAKNSVLGARFIAKLGAMNSKVDDLLLSL